jgi:hypothetical protein
MTRRQEPDFQAGPLGPDKCDAVANVEPFALRAVSVDDDRAIGEHTVNIEKDQLDE